MTAPAPPLGITPPLGIIAAGGPFPLRVAEAARKRGRGVFVVCVRDWCDAARYAHLPHAAERLGAGGAILARLREAGVRDLVLAGQAARPSLLGLLPDAWTARALARIGPAAFRGDDALLRAVSRLLEEEGFRLVAPQDVLAGALAAEGLLAGPEPDAMARADVARGVAVLRALAPQDVGQAVVVQQGLVLGVEAIEGTDALLARCGALRRDGPGGVLVKLPKAQQDRRLDPPVVGAATAEGARAAGLRGIAVEARGTLLSDAPATLAACAASGIFLLAINPGEFAPMSATTTGATTAGATTAGRMLHTMLRVGDLDRAVRFYTECLGMRELRRRDVPDGKYTLAFVGYAEESEQAVIELTYNYGVDRYAIGTAYGHVALGVPDIREAVEKVRAQGGTVTREPGPVKFGTTVIAFVEDPDGYKIELIERR